MIDDQTLIQALETCGSQKKAAQKLGINPRTLERRLKRLRMRGYSPQHDMTKVVPEGFTVKGVSTLYNRHGELTQQWVKSNQDAEQVAKMLEAAFAGLGDELPREKRVAAPKNTLSDLANCYILTDYHLGMLSWGEETGDDWDIQIAEDMLVAWFARAIEMAPAAETAIFAQLGDFLHWDGMDAVTPASKHVLDADTRFQKLVRVAIRATRRIIKMLLTKHKHVHILMAEGNHDPASSVWLREWMDDIYSDEPRVTVDTRPDPYYCYEHGLTSLFFHHGHKKRMAGIDETFAAKFREVFGRTKFSYAHMGHLHHIEVKESSLMVVEQHRTLAASDAYATRGGWLSGRDAQVITYHKSFGEVSRVRISSQMIEAG